MFDNGITIGQPHEERCPRHVAPSALVPQGAHGHQPSKRSHQIALSLRYGRIRCTGPHHEPIELGYPRTSETSQLRPNRARMASA